MSQIMKNDQTIYKLIANIPEGKVLTYSNVAKLVGIKNPRVVGNILHKNPDPEKTPCHRVVNTGGQVAANYVFGGANKQKKNLEKEGVGFENGRVDLGKSLWRPKEVLKLYFQLLNKYGDPGPWPWFTGSLASDGQPPSTPEEITIGSILTQNTSWRNAEKALENLKKEEASTILGVYGLGKSNYKKLKELVRPSGYYNQKAKRLFEFSKYIIGNHQTLKNFFKLPTVKLREELLGLQGIGKETADTMLLYAGNKPIFVVDSYTKKFVEKKKLKTFLDYDSIRKFFSLNLPQNVELYQDYHALIVRWGKDK